MVEVVRVSKTVDTARQGGVGIVALARHLDLSVSTISRALNGYSDVSKSTRSRIEDAAIRLGYTPNARAQKLRLGRTDSVAFVLSPSQRQYADPFYLPLLTSIDENLSRLGLDLVVTASQIGEHELDVYQRLIDGHRVDGVIFSRTRANDGRIAFCQQRRFPFVTLGRSASSDPFASVDVDHGWSGHHAAKTLIDLGHRSLALLNTTTHNSYSEHCEAGFRLALEKSGNLIDFSLIEGGMTEESGDAIARTLLAKPSRPTGFVCGNDAMALGVMHAIAQAGLVVGRDVSVIGSNDVPIARFVSPGLTSYAAPVDEVGKMLVTLLHHQLTRSDAPPEGVIFRPEFRGRGSHGPSRE